jgi:hypothetical protein
MAQVLALGLLGSAVGVLIAMAVMAWIPAFLGPAVTAGINVSYRLTPSAVAQGAGTGLLVSMLFALVPLLDVRHVKPSQLLRDEELAGGRDWARWAAIIAVGGALVAVTMWQAGSFRIGGIVAAGFVPVVSLAWGWQASFHVIALFYAAALGIAWITRLDGPSGPVPRAARPSLRDAVTAMLGDRPTMLLAADGFLRVGIQYAFLTFLIAYAIDSLHLPVTWGALIYALAHLFGAVGRVGWGWTSDRIFHGRRRGPYAAIAVTAAAGFALLALAGPLHWLILLACVAILGLSAAGFQGVGLSLLAEIGGKRAGAASGLVNALSFLGAALMVPLCGQLLDAGASFATLFAILAAMSLLTAAITLALPSTTHEPPAHVAR